jgi:hypothetical protein
LITIYDELPEKMGSIFWLSFVISGISLELNRLSFELLSDLPQAPLHHSPCLRKLPTKKAVVVVVPVVMVLAASKSAEGQDPAALENA